MKMMTVVVATGANYKVALHLPHLRIGQFTAAASAAVQIGLEGKFNNKFVGSLITLLFLTGTGN